ncbi:redoxin domain-containing protein [Bradyrhizobium betae]|uniref:redoxin domain-containing protein n=1 Tax=Bradyrhizobium betae TaxID=244734 RepID=UPI003D67C1DE
MMRRAAICFRRTTWVPDHSASAERADMSKTLSEQLEEFLAGWMQRVPAERRAIMERHIAHLSDVALGKRARQVGDHAPPIVLPGLDGRQFDVSTLLAKGPVVVTFYRGGWCPYCNLELKAYQNLLPQIRAAGASLVAISPGEARRYGDDCGEERSDLSGVERCRSGGRQGIWPRLRLHR